jgi:hypothetical protein
VSLEGCTAEAQPKSGKPDFGTSFSVQVGYSRLECRRPSRRGFAAHLRVTENRRTSSFSRRRRVRVLPKATLTKSLLKKRSGAPGGAGVVGHATRTDVATRPRFGRGARHRRSACANRLLRARCASRRSTTIAVLRRGCRPPLREFRFPSPRAAGIVSQRPHGERNDSLSY